MKNLKKRTAKAVIAGVVVSMLGGYAAMGIAAAAPDDDPCPCPWWARLPWNPSLCMIQVFCEPGSE